jgi:signal transduction histidine kinase
MASPRTAGEDDYLIIFAPAGRDAEVVQQMLASGQMRGQIDRSGAMLLDALAAGRAAGAIVTEEGLGKFDMGQFRARVEAQPPWSDFPLILLSRRGETMRQGSRSIEDLGNVTILERPLHPATLVSAARSAVRSRRRQRLAQAYLEQREAAERALRDLAETLEQKVTDRTRALAQANDRLTAEIAERERAEARLVQSQKMEAVGQLTGGIAHDFNNLLTAVVGSLDLLMRHTDEPKLLRLARNAMEGAERGAQLTAQLLAFARRQRLEPEPVDANSVVMRMSDLFARTLGAHVHVETCLDPLLWPAMVDPTQLEMAILNLALNARDAMPGGGRLIIRTGNEEMPPPQIAAEVEPGPHIAISVRDTGTGMPPAAIARAFEPFFTTKAQGKGTGLGLSQVYGFARQSGGSVAIESREGEGTEVTIYLPRTEAGVRTGATASAAAPHATGARILLVDDDADVRSVAAAMLEELGYVVTAAASPAHALELVAEGRRFDLLLTDVAMPGMNGVELVRRVRAIAPDLPTLFASGYADIDSFGVNLVDEEVVKKPYRVAELAAHVDGILSGVRGGAEVIALHPTG